MQTSAQVPADFVEFYERFHSDSAYQYAHIHWPLSGKTAVQIDSAHVELREIKWDHTTWRRQYRVDFEKENLVQELEPLGDVMIIERIRTPDNSYSAERRFAKGIGNDWELIYYRDMFEAE